MVPDGGGVQVGRAVGTGIRVGLGSGLGTLGKGEGEGVVVAARPGRLQAIVTSIKIYARAVLFFIVISLFNDDYCVPFPLAVRSHTCARG